MVNGADSNYVFRGKLIGKIVPLKAELSWVVRPRPRHLPPTSERTSIPFCSPRLRFIGSEIRKTAARANLSLLGRSRPISFIWSVDMAQGAAGYITLREMAKLTIFQSGNNDLYCATLTLHWSWMQFAESPAPLPYLRAVSGPRRFTALTSPPSIRRGCRGRPVPTPPLPSFDRDSSPVHLFFREILLNYDIFFFLN